MDKSEEENLNTSEECFLERKKALPRYLYQLLDACEEYLIGLNRAGYCIFLRHSGDRLRVYGRPRL